MNQWNVEETIRKIESYGAKYSFDCFGGNAEDQLLTFEAIVETEQEEQKRRKGKEIKLKELGTSESDLNGSVNGSYKRQDKSEQILSKHQAIAKLGGCNYRTPPKEIALYLETIFGIWEKKPEHWLYIAQRYTPKTINCVLRQMIKEHQRGDKTFVTPGAYFTFVVKYRSKRKTLRNTNGTHKQQNDKEYI